MYVIGTFLDSLVIACLYDFAGPIFRFSHQAFSPLIYSQKPLGDVHLLKQIALLDLPHMEADKKNKLASLDPAGDAATITEKDSICDFTEGNGAFLQHISWEFKLTKKENINNIETKYYWN